MVLYSKAILRAAKAAQALRNAQTDVEGLGVSMEGEVKVDFPKVLRKLVVCLSRVVMYHHQGDGANAPVAG
jgi:hypothetical protein